MAGQAGLGAGVERGGSHRDADPFRLFHDVSEDEWLEINTAAASKFAEVLPSLPPESIQRKFVGKAGHEALVEGHTLAQAFKDLYREHVGPFAQSTRVLDYGCGWGRITRFFLKDVPAGNLLGIDCNDEMIELCRTSNPWSRFELNNPLPPTHLPGDEFDLIFSYSVFTHLREDVHLAWLDELGRLVKPGGLLILSVRPRHFISYCATLTTVAGGSHQPGDALVGLFPEPERALADYEGGRFVFAPYRYSAATYGDWTGEACISRAYVEREWTSKFELLDFIEDPDRFKQYLVVLRA
jgi:2-polyprenyl-3-methyl-5-hydroxy-6-metoxy-1,4-benzoquinol methylase